jgi:hypothetical protein
MDLIGEESHCGKSQGSHLAALLQTFDDGLKGLSLWPSFKDGLWWQNPYGKPPVHYSGPRMFVDFLKPGWQRGYSNDKSNAANLMTKAMMPIKSDPLNTTKHGNPMGQTWWLDQNTGNQSCIYLLYWKKLALIIMKADRLSTFFSNKKKQWQIAMPPRWEANWNLILGHGVPAI